MKKYVSFMCFVRGIRNLYLRSFIMIFISFSSYFWTCKQNNKNFKNQRYGTTSGYFPSPSHQFATLKIVKKIFVKFSIDFLQRRSKHSQVVFFPYTQILFILSKKTQIVLNWINGKRIFCVRSFQSDWYKFKRYFRLN